MKEKVLITGANGLLGQKLVNLFCSSNTYEVIAVARGKNRNNAIKGYTYYNIDLTNFYAVRNIANDVKPTIIINAAAMTNVDQCEDNKKECDLINVELVKCLVELSKKYHSYLVHISTDFIFDGKSGPYKEDDEPNPLSYYGLSKLKSEKLIENKKEVTIIDDQFRMPTFVDDLAQACVSAVAKKAIGVFNVSSCELLSIYDIALQVAKTFGLDRSYIKRISTKELNQKAPRPPVTGFDLTKSNKVLELPMVSFAERLQVFKSQLEVFNTG